VVTGTAKYSTGQMAASDGVAYFGYEGDVDKLSIADNTRKKIGSVVAPWGIGVSANYVYFTGRNEASVNRVAKAGGAVEPLTSTETQPTGLDIFENGSTLSVFWANYGTGKIRGKVGTGAVFDVCTGLTTPTLVTVSDNRVYVAQPDGQKSKIHWCDVTPPAQGDLVTGLTGLGVIKRHNDSLYWWVTNAGGSAGAITRRVIASGATTTPITDIEPHGIAIDDTSIYYLDGVVINRVAQNGSAKKKLATLTDKAISDMAVDDQCVWWLYNNGTIGRVDKD